MIVYAVVNRTAVGRAIDSIWFTLKDAEGRRGAQPELVVEEHRVQGDPQTLREVVQSIRESRLITVLAETEGNISKAAVILGVSRPTVHGMIDKYGVDLRALKVLRRQRRLARARPASAVSAPQ